MLLPIAAAVATAHERGVVHGDLSPANILFDAAGRPVLADLGAARAAGELGEPVSATPGYVAPEVARGAPLTAAADLFSLGAVALHCLTGRPAWNADDLRDVVIQSTIGQWPDPEDGAVAGDVGGGAAWSVGSRSDAASGCRRPGRRPAPLRVAGAGRPGAAPGPPGVRARPDGGPSGRAAATGTGGRGRTGARGPPGTARPASDGCPGPSTGIGVSALVVLAVLGGLWWATWERPDADRNRPGDGHGSDPVASRRSPAQRRRWPTDPRRPPQRPPRRPRHDPRRPAAAAASHRYRPRRPGALDGSDWLEVVRELDTRRAAALATPTSPASTGSTPRTPRPGPSTRAPSPPCASRGYGWKTPPTSWSAHIGSPPGGSAVTVEVVDELPAYPVLDEARSGGRHHAGPGRRSSAGRPGEDQRRVSHLEHLDVLIAAAQRRRARRRKRRISAG